MKPTDEEAPIKASFIARSAKQDGIKRGHDLMMNPKKGETVPEGFTCEKCLARDFFAVVFDAVIDWRECTDCAYAEEMRRECSDIF